MVYVIEHDDPTVLRCSDNGPLVYVATAVEVVGVVRTPVGVILHLDEPMFQAEAITVFLDPADARQTARAARGRRPRPGRLPLSTLHEATWQLAANQGFLRGWLSSVRGVHDASVT